MNRPSMLPAVALFLSLSAAGGCASPALVTTQRRTLQAMVQYRDQMAVYHSKMRDHLLAEKEAQLDAALAESLGRAADAEGRVAMEDVLERFKKRQALEASFRENLARLDGQVAARQEAFGRAIDLADDSLGLMEAYGRLPALVRNLAVREIEVEERIQDYDQTRSHDHGTSADEPETGGG